LQKISESMLYFTRVRKMETEPLSVRSLAEEAWSLVAIDEKASKVEFLNRAADGLCVIGNSDRLVQLFLNLLRNALLAVETGGTIEVGARRWAEDGREWVVIRVEDNGPGIPADVLPEVFEAFVTTRLDARGTGLGLTVAEGIVHQHGGTIVASNRPEGGACLEVQLPAAGSQVSEEGCG
jgi:signal transduction histidine kinase